MAQFEIVEPFDTDNGELDGLSGRTCFCLGVEWCTFYCSLKSGKPFTTLVLEPNASRLVALAERHNRFVEHHKQCAGWVRITVGTTRD